MAFLTYIAIYSNGKIPTEAEIAKIFGGGQGSIARGLAKLTLSLPVATLESGLVFCVLCFLYYHFHHILRPIKKAPFILAAFFSICMVFGKSYDLYDGSVLIWVNHFQAFFAVINFLGWLLLFYLLGNLILNWAEDYINKPEPLAVNRPQWIYTWKLPAFLLICWFPIIAAHFPASFMHDSFYQLLQWSGKAPFTTHHPFISTVFIGLFMDLGLFLGDANIGAFILVVIQTLLLIVAIVILIREMMKLHCPMTLVYFTIIFFALCPIWSGYVQCVVKDTLNISFNIFFIVIYINLIRDARWITHRRNQVFLLLSLFGNCCFRNTGMFLAILTLVPLLIYQLMRDTHGKCFRLTGSIFTLFIIVHVMFNALFLPWLGVQKGPAKEMLSIPFQQTARYMKYYPEDITPKEKKRIGNILDIKTMGKVYNPNLSDPVKDRSHVRKGNLVPYFKAWAAMGIRHPGVYIDAALNHTCGYFYPNSFNKSHMSILQLYIKEKSYDGRSPNDGTYDVKYLMPSKIRKAIDFYMTNVWNSIPIVGMCYNTGIYTWILMMCFMILIYFKDYYSILGLLPVIAILLFCLASPVNGFIRYLLPAIAALPLIIAWTLYSIRNEHENKGEMTQ